MITGIYLVTNTINNKRYVGSSSDICGRWQDHRLLADKGQHANRHFQAAWDKYGENAFRFEVLEVVADELDLLTVEQYYLDWLEPEYNIAKFAGSPMRGRRHSEKTLKRMSLAQLGESNPRYGCVPTAETRAKISVAHKGKVPMAAITKAAEMNRGRSLSDEHRAKISAGLEGRTLTDEHRAKIAASLKGRKPTPETSAKSSATKHERRHAPWNKGRKMSDEFRTKMSEIATLRAVLKKTKAIAQGDPQC